MQIQGPKAFKFTYLTKQFTIVNIRLGLKVLLKEQRGIYFLENGLDIKGRGTFTAYNNTVPHY